MSSSEFRMIVFSLEDLYDGAVLVKLVEKLDKVKLDLVEVTLNEELQKSNLKELLGVVHGLLDGSVYEKWTVEGEWFIVSDNFSPSGDVSNDESRSK